jgi:hypothetical protein
MDDFEKYIDNMLNEPVEGTLEKKRKHEKKEKKDKKKEKKHKKEKKDKKEKKGTTQKEIVDHPVEMQWVEVQKEVETPPPSTKEQDSKDKLARDSWMLAPPKRTSKQPIFEQSKKEEEKTSTVKELNPYLDDNGNQKETAVPDAATALPTVGDGGASWKARALRHAKEQAETEGRQLDAVVQERWNDVEELEKAAAKAQLKQRNQSSKYGKRDYLSSTK